MDSLTQWEHSGLLAWPGLLPVTYFGKTSQLENFYFLPSAFEATCSL